MNVNELNEKRKRLGMTYSDLSERSGVPYDTIAKLFQGVTTNPKTETLKKIEKALGVYEQTDVNFDENVLLSYYRRLTADEKMKLFNVIKSMFDSANTLPVETVSKYLIN